MQFGGTISCGVPDNPKHKNGWQWKVSANKASDFLKMVLPYIQIKHPQAELAIKFQSNKRHWGNSQKGHTTCLKPQESWAVEEAERILMGQYNKKGKM